MITLSEQLNLFDANSDYFEVGTDNLDLKKLNFKVHASLIYKLGESLIADEITALSELLKNAYDADASFCNLTIEPTFSDDGKIGKITVFDNGCGMDLQTIISGWLTISNSSKKKMKNNNQTTDKFHRIPLGEKGLGRLSVQKLGRKVLMITKQANSSTEYSITIPWDEFMKNTTLDQVDILCEKKQIENDHSYTQIIITDLINPDYWTQEANVKGLEKTVGKIVSPFKFKDNNFVISATVDNYKIDVSNAIFNDVLNTARCIYTFSVNQNSIKLVCKYKLDFFRRRKIEGQYSDFDFQRDYFQEMFSKNHEAIEGWKYNIDGDILFEIESEILFDGYSGLLRNPTTGVIYHPGIFEGEIYDFYYDKLYLSALINNHALTDAFNEAEYSKYVKENKGIKVIRDGFVVQGYGDGNVDWLNLSGSATTTGKYSDLNNESIIGYVKLAGENNQSLKETTSREGFVADEYYKNFYFFLRQIIIKKINQQNQKLMKSYTDYLRELFASNDSQDTNKPTERIEQISNKAAEVSRRVLDQVDNSKKRVESMVDRARKNLEQPSFVENTTHSAKSEYEAIINEQSKTITEMQQEFDLYLQEVEKIKSQVFQIQQLIDSYNKRISDVFELAGLGISVELFTHEMYTTINNVNEKLRKVAPQTEELRYVSNAMNSLRKQLSYFHPGLKYVRLKKDTTTIGSLIQNHLDFYHAKCETQAIKQTFINHAPNVSVQMNIGLFNQVLDNLFSNSYYWLQYSRDKLKNIDFCEYTVELFPNATIDIWDNGIGVSRDIETDLFNPFVSCKEDGRGLGLFICKNNLENNSSSIRLLRERNALGNLYKFHVDLSNLKIE